MFRPLILLLSFTALIGQAWAQQAEIDRLNDRLRAELAPKGTKADTARAEVMVQLAELYVKVDPDRALDLCKDALGISIRHANNRLVSRIYNCTGTVNRIKGDYEKAIQFHERALETDRKSADRMGIALSLNNLGNAYLGQGRLNEARQRYAESLAIRQDLGDQAPIAASLNNLGMVYRNMGDHDKALVYYQNALRIFQQQNDQLGTANALNNIGIVQRNQGNLDRAMESFQSALKVFEKEYNKVGMAFTLNNIGNIYQQQGNQGQALSLYDQSLKLSEELGDRASAAGKYNNMGAVYHDKGDMSSALDMTQRALRIQRELGDQSGQANTLNNLGAYYREQGDADRALESFLEAERIQRRTGDNNYTVETLTSIGELYSKKGEGGKGLRYLEGAMEAAKEKRSGQELQRVYTAMSEAYAQAGDFERSYRYQKLNANLKDSLERTVNVRQLAEMQAKFETERKQREIDQLNRDREVKDLVMGRQRMVRNLMIVLAVLIMALAVVLFQRYRAKQRANEELGRKNEEIEAQRSILKEKNEEITDSIEYAKRIQDAILPSLDEVTRVLPQSFIYFRPKAIVSGDFYWFNEVNGTAFLAAVDCTGHGVPGAFMSMIGNDHLNQVVLVEGCKRPDEILNRLHAEVQHTLRQRHGLTETHVGMDIALCAIDLESGLLQFAAANRYLMLFRGEELTELKGDHLNVGGIMHEDVRNYTLHELQLNPGDCLYMFSDGVTDQFGGPDDRKFGYRRLREMLRDIRHLPMQDQRATVERGLLSWMGQRDQIDDFVLIGVRV
jgi:tetratricopeptide (TPR) repeat protein